MTLGLLAIWVSAVIALITLYIAFSFVTPMIGTIDNFINQIVNQVPMDELWKNLYYNVQSQLSMIWSTVMIVFFISILIWVVIQSARREPQEEIYES